MTERLKNLNIIKKIDKCNINYYKYKFDKNPKLVFLKIKEK